MKGSRKPTATTECHRLSLIESVEGAEHPSVVGRLQGLQEGS
jgi:hypothetical protein